MGTAPQTAPDPVYESPRFTEYYARIAAEKADANVIVMEDSWQHSPEEVWARTFDPGVRYTAIAAWFVGRNPSWCYKLPDNVERAARELAKTTLPLEIFERLFAGRMMVGDLSQFRFFAMYIVENIPSSVMTAGSPVEPEIYTMFKPYNDARSGCSSSYPTNRDIILDWGVSARIVLHELTHWLDDQLLFGGRYTLRTKGVFLGVQDVLAELRLGMEIEFKRIKHLHDTRNPVRVISRYALLDSCEWFAEAFPKYVQKPEEHEENRGHWPATWALLDYIFKEKIFL